MIRMKEMLQFFMDLFELICKSAPLSIVFLVIGFMLSNIWTYRFTVKMGWRHQKGILNECAYITYCQCIYFLLSIWLGFVLQHKDDWKILINGLMPLVFLIGSIYLAIWYYLIKIGKFNKP